MAKEPTRRRAETRARLIAAATSAFADLGFGGATIEEICHRAGYTPGAYYSNFASKNELLHALFADHSARLLDRLRTQLAELDEADLTPEQLAEFVVSADPDQRTWHLVSTEFTLYAIRNPEAAAVMAEHDARVRAEIVEVLGQAFDRMGRRPVVDLDEFTRLLIALREGGLMQSLIEPDELPQGALERAYLPVLFTAVSRKTGRGAKRR
ncbi:TetR/AcrR family transcriptional regulator [Amycolatopsis halotolerans]|uniref:TetR/AcrR family transcriptional regulator n=1 Tax=Amycolatopsis halotolerans TaxID=330083 RepID=A0ABV7QCM7_9PSEU